MIGRHEFPHGSQIVVFKGFFHFKGLVRNFLEAFFEQNRVIFPLGVDKGIQFGCIGGDAAVGEYHPDRLYRVEEDGSVIAPQFSFKVTNNIFKPVARQDNPPTDRNGRPIKQPYFVPVCIDGQLMAALINAPRVVIEEFVE